LYSGTYDTLSTQVRLNTIAAPQSRGTVNTQTTRSNRPYLMSQAELVSNFKTDLFWTVDPLGGDSSRITITDVKEENGGTLVSFSVSKSLSFDESIGRLLIDRAWLPLVSELTPLSICCIAIAAQSHSSRNVLSSIAAQLGDSSSPLLHGVVTTHLDTATGLVKLSVTPGTPNVDPNDPYVDHPCSLLT